MDDAFLIIAVGFSLPYSALPSEKFHLSQMNTRRYHRVKLKYFMLQFGSAPSRLPCEHCGGGVLLYRREFG